MLNDILSDYLPILTQEERRGLALLYASLQRSRSVTELDQLFHRFLPLCLIDPNLLNELLLTNVSKQLFGISLEEKSDENESFKTIRSEIIYRAMCITLGASQQPRDLFPSGTSELYWSILQVLPPSSFLTRLCHLIATLDASHILTEVNLVLGKEAEQLFLVLVKHVLGRVSDDDLRAGISVERFVDIVYETGNYNVVLADPSCAITIDPSQSEVSALEYVFEKLRSEEGGHHHIPVLLKDSEFEERVSVVLLRGTTWREEGSDRLDEYVLCTGIETNIFHGEIASEQVLRSCTGVHLHFDHLGRVLIKTKELIRHMAGILLLKNLQPSEFKTIEILGDGILLSKILSPLTCDSRGIEAQPVAVQQCGPEEEEVEYTVTYITKEENLTSEEPTPVVESRLNSDIRKEPPHPTEVRTVGPAVETARTQQTSVISSAFWWGADPHKSYK